MGTAKDEKFLAGKRLGGRPAVVEERLSRPVKPHKPRVLSPQEWKFVEEYAAGDGHGEESGRGRHFVEDTVHAVA